jgi:hypothetical protein
MGVFVTSGWALKSLATQSTNHLPPLISEQWRFARSGECRVRAIPQNYVRGKKNSQVKITAKITLGNQNHGICCLSSSAIASSPTAFARSSYGKLSV